MFCQDCGSKPSECMCSRRRSRERRERERQQLEADQAGVTSLLWELAEEFEKTSKEASDEIKSKLLSIKAGMKEMKCKVEANKTKIEEHGISITNIEKRLAHEDATKLSGGIFKPMKLDGEVCFEFTSNHVEIKGHCTFKEKMMEGVGRKEIFPFIHGFK